MIDTHEEALRVLATEPRCVNAAIAALERFAPAQPAAWSDLSAAYYVRAQRTDEPQDLLRALQAALHATTATPQSAAAHFNRALAEQALGLTDGAMQSWKRAALLDESAWSEEAAAHRDRLARQRATEGATEWRRNLQQLPQAVKSGDRRAVASLVAPFPAAAQRHVIREVLREWAATGAEERLQYAGVLAVELTAATGDPYLQHVVDAIARSRDRRQARAAHVAYYEALKGGAAAGAQYRRAIELLREAGSPLWLNAELAAATALSYEAGRLGDAMKMLEPVAREAHRHNYRQIAGRVHSSRGFFLMLSGRYIDSLREYASAASQLTLARDRESVATFHSRQIGIYRLVGQTELAWREAFQAQRFANVIVDTKERHVLLGEVAETVAALGYPAIALQYQNSAIRLIERALASASAGDRRALELNLGVALRGRAGIELRLGREERAREDLEQSLRLADEHRRAGDRNVHRALLARIEELRGATLLQSQPLRATEAFTRALELAQPEGYRTFRASLLAQRAEAYDRAKDPAAAQRDLRDSVRELRLEEAQMLARRQPGAHEEVWSTYFSRFRDTYERLVRQLVQDGDTDQAFAYAERSRAFEPLDVILQRPRVVPAEFRRMTAGGRTPTLAEIQAKLPDATFLIQYFVLHEQTYAWVASRDRSQFIALAARRADIDRWSGDLQRAAGERKPLRFDLGLYPAFDTLVREPLSIIEQWPGAHDPGRRLVFVPDQTIHGLPLAALRNPSTRRYLIEDYAVEIAGSATLYVFSLIRDGELSATRPSAFLVGDPEFDPKLPIARALDRVPRAESEVRRIGRLYAPRAELRVGAEATVPDFLQRARHSSVVHVAAHAIANARAPFSSLLLFAPSAQHSGVLTAEELLERAELEKTRLFIMSACSSAGGSPVGPEGLAPLVRPLIAAGVPAVIGSLWDVDDAAAEALLVSFHKHYLQGKDAAGALRAAQLEVIRQTHNPGLRSVLAWAPFQVIGHTSSPAPTAN